MLNKFIITLSALLLAGFVANAQNGLKIGIVNVETIVVELPEAKDADEKIRAAGQKFQDTLQALQTDLQTKLEDYQKQQSMMTPDQKQSTEQELQALNAQLMQYQQEKFGQSGELAIMREQFLGPIRKKVQDAIDKVAKEEKLDLVFDKSAGSLRYSLDKYDITFKVIDTLKRGSATTE